LSELTDEAYRFIQETALEYQHENVIISFSGGKDSTVVADLVVRALSDPSIVHIFGNTTLEFPSTIKYTDRYRKDNPKAIFKTAVNKEQDFYAVCDDIGPPARMLRWCCSMFKTGPITRVLNRLHGDEAILTFYGIRKCESLSRSRYNRVEDNAESVKIQKQKVASPIFLWKDLDVWLYILGERIDFNDAYHLGYDRVGCWCCPNNNLRAQFLSKIYMPEQSERWRNFLVDFAKRIGKPDAEEYIDTGAWKARQGGNGLIAAQDIKIRYTNCTTEDNTKIYQLNKPISPHLISLPAYPLD
jgi:phosphoadenosine phosphosulfate reductase